MNVLRRSVVKVCRALNACETKNCISSPNNPLLGKTEMLTKEAAEGFNSRHQKAVELVEYLKSELANIDEVLRQRLVSEELAKLTAENQRLKDELKHWQAKVVELEVQQGIKQVPVPTSSFSPAGDAAASPPREHVPEAKRAVSPPAAESESKEDQPSKKTKKTPGPKKSEKTSSAPKDDAKEVHVGRLDLRIGRILSVEKHPDADSLYVEKIDLGEANPRTVVSGLVKFVPIEEMQDRLVMVLCNLKPVKMRGVTSEAMVMCASTPEKVEILNPPHDAVPGDRVTCDEYPGEPDPMLNPKKKIFEQVAPDLKTDGDCVATYKSSPLKVGSKGVVKAPSLAGVSIK